MTRSAVAFFCVVLHMAAATSASAQFSAYYWERELTIGDRFSELPFSGYPRTIAGGTLTAAGAGEDLSVAGSHADGRLQIFGEKGRVEGRCNGEIEWDWRPETPAEEWFEGVLGAYGLLRLSYYQLIDADEIFITEDIMYKPKMTIQASGNGHGVTPYDVIMYLRFTMIVDGLSQSWNYTVNAAGFEGTNGIVEPSFPIDGRKFGYDEPYHVAMEIEVQALITRSGITTARSGSAGGNLDFSHTFQWLGATVEVDGVPVTGLTITDTDGDGTDWTGMVPAAQCTPDLNGDGILDNGDIQAFITLFLAGDLASDMNGDGILDNGDIQAFVTAFLAGCS